MDVEDLVKSYFRLGFSNKEIICLLAHQHGVIISKRTLQRLCRKCNLIHVAAEWRNLPGSNNILISDWLVGGARPDFAELDACVPGSTYEELFSKTL